MSEEEARKELLDNFTIDKGIIMPKEAHHIVTPIEKSAIQYLEDEWDYAFINA